MSQVDDSFSYLQASSPDQDWGPYLKQHRGSRYAGMREPQEAVELLLEAEHENQALDMTRDSDVILLETSA